MFRLLTHFLDVLVLAARETVITRGEHPRFFCGTSGYVSATTLVPLDETCIDRDHKEMAALFGQASTNIWDRAKIGYPRLPPHFSNSLSTGNRPRGYVSLCAKWIKKGHLVFPSKRFAAKYTAACISFAESGGRRAALSRAVDAAFVGRLQDGFVRAHLTRLQALLAPGDFSPEGRDECLRHFLATGVLPVCRADLPPRLRGRALPCFRPPPGLGGGGSDRRRVADFAVGRATAVAEAGGEEHEDCEMSSEPRSDSESEEDCGVTTCFLSCRTLVFLHEAVVGSHDIVGARGRAAVKNDNLFLIRRSAQAFGQLKRELFCYENECLLRFVFGNDLSEWRPRTPTLRELC